ncbi:NADAR family protein [Chamaesiphon sp.]|uniref:NADAR family protein n=1 Tax=Chamaesiphon sp. TaxID=2814140 RepID=UPI0035946AF6
MNINKIKDRFDRGESLDYLFFWSHRPNPDGAVGKTCFSQWFEASFEIDGISYKTAEHYMMAAKARLFDDRIILPEILAANHPRQTQILGRKIQGFQETIWNEHRFQIVVDGNVAKFQQNPLLTEFILNTQDRILVEASPDDRIWGIGLAADNPNIKNPHLWQGNNLLGFALMEVRSLL